MTEDIDPIAEFETSARLYGDAVAASDVKSINEHAHRMSRLFHQCLASSASRQRFLALLDNTDESVRLMTSAFGLQIDEESCVRNLRALAAGGCYAFEAEQCLQRWTEGEWALDVPPPDDLNSSGEFASSEHTIDALSLGRSLAKEIPLSDVREVDDLDMRIGCVSVHFANIIGVGERSIEFCPNSEPPADDEVLAWTWVVRPDLKESILMQLGDHEFAEGVRQLV